MEGKEAASGSSWERHSGDLLACGAILACLCWCRKEPHTTYALQLPPAISGHILERGRHAHVFTHMCRALLLVIQWPMPMPLLFSPSQLTIPQLSSTPLRAPAKQTGTTCAAFAWQYSSPAFKRPSGSLKEIRAPGMDNQGFIYYFLKESQRERSERT